MDRLSPSGSSKKKVVDDGDAQVFEQKQTTLASLGLGSRTSKRAAPMLWRGLDTIPLNSVTVTDLLFWN